MALRFTLTIAPLLVLLMFTVVASGNAASIQAQGTQIGVCNPQNCTAGSGGNIYTCTVNTAGFQAGLLNTIQQCQISITQLSPMPFGAAYYGPVQAAIYGIPAGTYIPLGSQVLVPTDVVNQIQTSSAQVFVFGSVNSSGFTIMLLVAAGLIALAGLTIFGSGESAESIHILFTIGMLLGIWIMFAAAEGVISGSTASGFLAIDKVTPGLGTGLFVFLSLVYTLGAVASISRGGG